MLFKGKYKGKTIDEGEFIINLIIPFNQRKMVSKLKDNTEYNIDIKEIKDKRSLQQNKYMWALLRDIAEEMNGDYNAEEVYCMCIEDANIKCDIILAKEEVKESLEKFYRVVKPMEYAKGNKEWRYFKLYKGSSHFDTKEMTTLIDSILDVASHLGIDTDYWSDLLK